MKRLATERGKPETAGDSKWGIYACVNLARQRIRGAGWRTGTVCPTHHIKSLAARIQ